jgi:GAF domain-containing protein
MHLTSTHVLGVLVRGLTRDRSVAPAVPGDGGTPRDVENFAEVIKALDAVTDEDSAYLITITTFARTSPLIHYGAVWRPIDGQLRKTHEVGDLVPHLKTASPDMLSLDSGLIGQAYRTREAVFVDDLATVTTCRRAAVARANGMHAGFCYPVTHEGQVTAVLEYYASAPLAVDAGRRQKVLAIARLADMAVFQAIAKAQLQEVADDRLAVTDVVNSMSQVNDELAATRIALETVRKAFGWAYGSYWRVADDEDVLRFELESGSAGDEFREVTLRASFAEGVGLSGRAWKARDLVFVPDLAELTDCVRAPAAGRAGVKSGVCFPITINGRVIGTMDFFTTTRIDLSESRMSALRNVQQLVSQRIEGLRRTATEKAGARP